MQEQFLILTSITVLVLISPGPDMSIVLRNTLFDGRIAGLQTSAGVLTGNLVHISYSVFGIGLLIANSIVLFNALKYLGAAYLLFLGLSSFRQARFSFDAATAAPQRRARSAFLQGFINNVLNPKGALFYLGVFTLVITPETSVSGMIILVTWMMFLCALFWLVFVSTLGQTAVRRFFEQSQAWLSRIFGGLLVFLGIRVALLERAGSEL